MKASVHISRRPAALLLLREGVSADHLPSSLRNRLGTLEFIGKYSVVTVAQLLRRSEEQLCNELRADGFSVVEEGIKPISAIGSSLGSGALGLLFGGPVLGLVGFAGGLAFWNTEGKDLWRIRERLGEIEAAGTRSERPAS